MRASASPLYDAAGTINGVVASARDVTDSKTVEKQNLQKEKLAAMGEMMSGVAHELNNPLTAILGVSDLLRERAPDDATRRQTEIILKQARRAAVIVQNLLAYARPSALARKKMRPEEALQAAIDQQRPALSQKNISIELAPPPAGLALEADPKLLHQVFVNLIVNAEQAITSHGERCALPSNTATAKSPSYSRMMGPAFLLKTSAKSSIRFLPPSVRAAAPAWGWRFARPSLRSTADPSKYSPSSARARNFACACWSMRRNSARRRLRCGLRSPLRRGREVCADTRFTWWMTKKAFARSCRKGFRRAA